MEPPPLADKHNFLFKGILKCDPTAAWKYCYTLQEQWNAEFVKDEELARSMYNWRRLRSIRLVWLSDKLGDTLPGSASVLLYKILDELETGSPNYMISQPAEHCNIDCDAEDGRRSERQLRPHLKALIRLTTAASNKEPLSIALVKSTHKMLMAGLCIDGEEIDAGEYRKIAMRTGHVGERGYPDHCTIMQGMQKIIDEYNKNSDERHDPFKLGSWLIFQVLTLHPFRDGNGRVSRLLWCFSLLRDGLPFPMTPFPGIRKAYKKYIGCIQKDQDDLSPNFSCKYLTSLTVISITQTWREFLSNLEQENPEKFQVIQDWLVRSKNIND